MLDQVQRAQNSFPNLYFVQSIRDEEKLIIIVLFVATKSKKVFIWSN